MSFYWRFESIYTNSYYYNVCAAFIVLLNFGVAVCVLNGTLCFHNHAFAFISTVSLISSFLSSARNNASGIFFSVLFVR